MATEDRWAGQSYILLALLGNGLVLAVVFSASYKIWKGGFLPVLGRVGPSGNKALAFFLVANALLGFLLPMVLLAAANKWRTRPGPS